MYKQVQQHIHDNTLIGKHEGRLKPLSQVCNERDAQLLSSIITSPEGSPPKTVTFQPNSLRIVDILNTRGIKERVGQPTVKWVDTGLDNLWQLIQKDYSEFKYEK